MFLSRKAKSFLLPFALCAGLFSCASSTHIVAYAYGYGTNWEIHLYEGKQADADEIEEYVRKTSRILDLQATSEPHGVAALNRDGYVEADSFLLEAYEVGNRLEQEFPLCYEATLGRLVDAWQKSLEKKQVLDEETKITLLQEAKDTIIERNGNGLEKIGLGWADYGSLGKGLCLRHIQESLKEKGIAKYFINAGTSSMGFGVNSSKDGTTRVNLIDAQGYYFQAKDCAVSTSSVTREPVTIAGKNYSHIIDPRTGDACLDYDACVLKGSDAGYLDGLSTALIVAGPEYANIAEKQGIEVAFAKNGNIVYETKGFLQKQ